MLSTSRTLTTRDTTDHGKRWTVSAGPRQAKAVEESRRRLARLGRTRRELTDFGPRLIESPFDAVSAEAQAALDAVGEQFDWQLTGDNYQAVAAAFAGAAAGFVIPTVDCRHTAAEREQRSALEAERQQRDAEALAARQASKAAIAPHVPAWAEALIVAEFERDTCDIQSDYFATQTERRVVIGFRRGKREDFRQLRAAAAQLAPTAHLGPGRDRWSAWLRWRENSQPHEPHHFAGDRAASIEWAANRVLDDGRADWSGTSFTNEAELDAFLAHAAALLGPDAERVEAVKHFDSFEHRENYSMGGGNYLKAGGHYSTGWVVRSQPLSYLDSYVFELALPAPSADQPAEQSGETPRGVTIELHRHTKRGFHFHLVRIAERVGRDRFKELLAACESARGWYSRAWEKTPGGFAFRERSAAEAFAKSIGGGDILIRCNCPCPKCAASIGGGDGPPPDDDGGGPGGEPAGPPQQPEAPPASEQTADPDQRRREQIAVQLEQLAERAESKRDHAQRPMTQNPTPKRSREYLARLHDGENMGRTARALRALAAGWRQGNLPSQLERLRTSTAVAPLVAQGRDHGREGYYDVVPSGKYTDSTPTGQLLQRLIDQRQPADPDRESASRLEWLRQGLVGRDIPGWFPTPPDLAERMAQLADLRPGQAVLEPSAGDGALIEAAYRACDSLDVEAAEQCRPLQAILRERWSGVRIYDDCFDLSPAEGVRYDRIMMNPPFKLGQDWKQLAHAWRLLAPGGRLVAIVSAGLGFREDNAGRAFRAWRDENGATVEELPSGTFDQPGQLRRTAVASLLVVADQPAEAPQPAAPMLDRLQPYIAAEIAAGNRNPESILRSAIDHSNDTAREMIDQRSQRSRDAQASMCAGVWAEHQLENVARQLSLF